MPKFSVIIPVYSGPLNNENHFRGHTVQRAIKSVLNQQFIDWELIVVDDGSVDEFTPGMLENFTRDSRVKVIHTENLGRAYARNTGMDNANGEWLCWLDSDDEYSTHYLRALNYHINQNPEYRIFNFGSIVYHGEESTSIRDTFRPEIDGEGHEYFKSGGIGAGSFIFRRDLWQSDRKYRIPDESSPYHFAAASKIDLKYAPDTPDIENPAGAFADGVYRHGLSLGNPWGDDFCQFFYLTRDNYSKPLDLLLYIQYVRSTEDTYGQVGQIYDVPR